MCEEPMSSFDAKINNENMTKCLQSLKEMYQDLRNKGVFCASEAEFQGYNVLLNLNKGDILRCVFRFGSWALMYRKSMVLALERCLRD